MEELIVFLVGWVSFSLFMLITAKNRMDKAKEKFVFSVYFEHNWDDLLFTFICALGLDLVAPDMFLILMMKYEWMEGIHWSNLIPYTIGAFGGLIFQGIYETIKLIIELIKKRIRKTLDR